MWSVTARSMRAGRVAWQQRCQGARPKQGGGVVRGRTFAERRRCLFGNGGRAGARAPVGKVSGGHSRAPRRLTAASEMARADGNGRSAHFLYAPDVFAERPMTRREQELEQLLAPTVRGLGCEIWGVEYFPAGRGGTLRVYIDAPDGVTIDDCERVSAQLSGVLEVEAPIRSDYTLEVSSPGMDRVLFKAEQYAPFKGAELDVRLKFPLAGRRRLVGRLAEASEREVVLQVEGDRSVVPMEQIQRARVVPQYE